MDDPKPGCSGIKKRKFNLINKDNEYGKKRREDEDNSIILSVSDKCILDLPDDVIFIIGRKLKPFDLYSLSRTCSRFDNIMTERSLWKYVDFRDTTDITTNLLNHFNRFLSPSTIEYSTRSIRRYDANSGYDPLMTGTLLQTINTKCTELKILRIERDVIMANELTMKDMPPSLEVLSLSETYMMNKPSNFSYFFRIEKCLPRLTTICLRNCNWFEPHSLMLLSKLPLLQHLDLSYCRGMKECMAYFSLSARYGFLQLKTFDLRGTRLCDSEISCLNILPSLAKLLLDCPQRTYGTPDQYPFITLNNIEEDAAEAIRYEVQSLNELRAQEELNDPDDVDDVDGVDELPLFEAVIAEHELRRAIEVRLQEGDGVDRNIDVIPDLAVEGPEYEDDDDEDDRRQLPLVLPEEIPINNNRNEADNIIADQIIAELNSDEMYRNVNVILARRQPLPESSTSDYLNYVSYPTAGSGRAYQLRKPNHKTTQTNVATSHELDEMDAYLEDRTKQKDRASPSYGLGDFAVDFERHQRFVTVHLSDRSRLREAAAILNGERPSIGASITENYCFLSDRAICSFGTSPASNEPNLVRIQAEYMPQQREPVLEHLALRNYVLITDQSLRHLAHAAPKLKFLDVTGTKVTKKGVIQFNMERPDCEILSNYLIDQSDS